MLTRNITRSNMPGRSRAAVRVPPSVRVSPPLVQKQVYHVKFRNATTSPGRSYQATTFVARCCCTNTETEKGRCCSRAILGRAQVREPQTLTSSLSHCNRLGLLATGCLWLLALPLSMLHSGTYIDENALQPSQVPFVSVSFINVGYICL